MTRVSGKPLAVCYLHRPAGPAVPPSSADWRDRSAWTYALARVLHRDREAARNGE